MFAQANKTVRLPRPRRNRSKVWIHPRGTIDAFATQSLASIILLLKCIFAFEALFLRRDLWHLIYK